MTPSRQRWQQCLTGKRTSTRQTARRAACVATPTRAAALLLPAIFFASLHVNWTTLVGLPSLAPLVVLAVIFSLAYERTGTIGTAIVAHALFNLNTILLILAGVID